MLKELLRTVVVAVTVGVLLAATLFALLTRFGPADRSKPPCDVGLFRTKCAADE